MYILVEELNDREQAATIDGVPGIFGTTKDSYRCFNFDFTTVVSWDFGAPYGRRVIEVEYSRERKGDQPSFRDWITEVLIDHMEENHAYTQELD